jgi:hypothetical protein
MNANMAAMAWRLTSDINACNPLLVKNQNINVPGGGIMRGYFFVACSVFCSSVR